MKEFDFEELDKAVNTALGSDGASDDTTDRAEDIEQDQSEVKSDPTPVRVVSPAARRSSGRFMDMVHVSSDMRRSGKAQAASPRRDEKTDDDLFGFNGPLTTESDTPVERDMPLQSPFLPDAVVEKRPLGQPAQTPSDILASDTPLEELFAEPEQELLEEGPETLLLEATDAPDAPVTPEETSVVDVAQDQESSDLGEPFADAAVFEEPVEHRSEFPTVPVQKVVEDIPETTEAIAVHQPEEIAPQPSAVYDTEVYHAPTVASKKRSGGLTALWVFLLIILGAGAGVAVYFFVLPLL